MILPLLVTFYLQSNISLFLKQFLTVLVSVLSQIVRNQAPISMGFASRGVWVMGYCGCMGYEVLFPANQLGGLKTLWDLRQYRVCEPWVMKESTVNSFIGAHDTAWGLYFHSHSS